MCELERDEREQGRRRRVPAPGPRPLEHGSRLSPSALHHPHRRVGERAPRAEHAPDVPEQDRQERDPQPEDHVHERGREVEELDRRAEERRRERQAEQEDGERTEDDAHRAREDETGEPGGQLSPARMRLEHRPAPEIEEEDERDGEDDRRADEEVDRGDRKVANDADPVGDDHALTVMSAIGTPRSSSSTSNRPGIVALNGSRAGLPGATSRMMS